MKAKLVVFSCALFISVIAGVARADVQQQPGTKWFQPPEMEEEWGFDVGSNWDNSDNLPKAVVADNWRCEDNTSPVKGFRWWGSYFGDHSIDDIRGFYISIHGDIPAVIGGQSSQPLYAILHEQYFDLEDLGYEEGGYQRYIGDDYYDDPVYEYSASFDECFWQEGTPENPVIYWVNIVALADLTGVDIDYYFWGWHTSNTQNIDDAVSLDGYNFATGAFTNFTPLEWAGYGSLDMAFEVIPEHLPEHLPEPGTLLLAVPGLIGLAAVIRRRK